MTEPFVHMEGSAMEHPSSYYDESKEFVVFEVYEDHDGLDEFRPFVGLSDYKFKVPKHLAREFVLAKELFNRINAKVYQAWIDHMDKEEEDERRKTNG